jgi:hypothetical protein
MRAESSLTGWLLEEEPSVVYHAVKDLRGKGDGDKRVKRAFAAIPERSRTTRGESRIRGAPVCRGDSS